MTTQVLKIESLNQKIFWLLVLTLGVILATYVYFVNDLIFNVADRESLIHERTNLGLKISQLEGQYLTLAKVITANRAYELGFEEAGINSSFVAQNGSVLALDTSSRRQDE